MVVVLSVVRSEPAGARGPSSPAVCLGPAPARFKFTLGATGSHGIRRGVTLFKFPPCDKGPGRRLTVTWKLQA